MEAELLYPPFRGTDFDMKKLILLLVTAVTLSPMMAHADLIGTSVDGTIAFAGFPQNFFNPLNGLVPAGYGNSAGLPVTVGSGIEFGLSDDNLLYTFDFSGTTLTVTNTVGVASPENAFVASFTDTGFAGLNLSTLSNTMAGLTASLSGNVLTVNFAGHLTPATVVGNVGTGVFSLAAASTGTPGVVPEPSTLALLGSGALAAAGFMRRRFS